jgi:hypothetical protein
VKRDVVSEITAVELQAADPIGMARRWAEVIGRGCTEGANGARVDLDRGSIRFVADQDGRGDGVTGFEVSSLDPDAVLAAARQRNLVVEHDHVEICGTRIYVVN